MAISGFDDAGVEWSGDVDLDVDDDGDVRGTIEWSSSSDLSGTETVEGRLEEDGTLRLWGTSVSSSDIVTCEYEGTWIDGAIDVEWVGRCPGGHASGTEGDD